MTKEKDAGKYWKKAFDNLMKGFKEQQKEIKKIEHLLSLTSDTCEQQVDELIEQQKEIDDCKHCKKEKFKENENLKTTNIL